MAHVSHALHERVSVIPPYSPAQLLLKLVSQTQLVVERNLKNQQLVWMLMLWVVLYHKYSHLVVQLTA